MKPVAGLALSMILAGAVKAQTPNVLLMEGAALVALRNRIKEGSSPVAPALAQLREEAEKALAEGPWSVVDKPFMPPSGDKHDYMSVGPYWWPDPATPDGKPYIRKDGVVNPDRHKYDNVGLSHTVKNSFTLALAWFYCEKPAYAEHAATLLRTWFIEPATRMNPNLNFGQAIPGRCDGRGIGIIDTACLVQAVDAALLLEDSPAWSQADGAALREWFGAYLDWLRTSSHGRDEGRTKNNHATWYDVQLACFALYSDQAEIARTVLEVSRTRRIEPQIKPDGAQPHEIARTKSWNYSSMNLKGFFDLATLGDHVDVDLWNFRTKKTGGVRGALDFMVPYAVGEAKWPHKQISSFNGRSLAPLMRRAAVVYREPAYEGMVSRCMEKEALLSHRFQLMYPPR